MKNYIALCFGTSVLITSALCVGGLTPMKFAPKHVVVYRDVAKTLTNVCGKCHKGAKAADGLNLTNYASIMRGDKEGKVVISGNPSKSRLITVLHGKPALMPPGGALPNAQTAQLTAWIKAGAKAK
jgi:hypothetical protein